MSSEETISAVLQRIERAESGAEALGAFVTLCPEQALAAAAQADTDLRRGVDRGALQGVPVAVKDILATRDMPTSAQSNAFTPSWDDDYEADAVRRLRDAGAVIVGKTTTSEFAIGLPDSQSGFPLPRNPWRADRWAGGSSAGSASGRAAGLFAGALGTDTGGSIRVPASFCGVTGFKPSFDVVSRAGCLPLSKTLDHVGPLARTAEDCSLLMAAIARGGWMPSDLEMPPGDRAVIGVPRFDEHQLVGVDPAALTILDETIATLRDSGFETRIVEVPWFVTVADAVNVVMQCEALQVHSKNLERRWRDYGRDTRQRLAVGAFYTGEDYLRALDVLTRARAHAEQLFASVDCLVCLTSGVGAWKLADISLEGSLRPPFFTRVWNGLGVPAISVPAGLDNDGLPIGVQFIAARASDMTALRFAHAFQQATTWHTLEAPLAARTKATELAAESSL